MKTLLNSFLKKRYSKKRSPLFPPNAGLTMIELLVGTVIATIIIVPMLTFVVDMLNRDVREQAKTNSEQELQAAVDYIAQDISQAFYIYSNSGVNTIKDQLPHSDDDTKTPILVFWKRELVEKALNFSLNICDSDDCNDTFVLSLVTYYLINDNNTTWCQPSGGNCPKRIARFQIQDGVKVQNSYICGSNGRDSSICSTDQQTTFMRDLGYEDYQSNPEDWTKADDETYTNNLIVLVNYIQDFKLNSVNNNELAKITIQGDALRRIKTSDTNCSDSPTYCPKATAQVGARSGLGTSQ
ncbi:MAG: hormogonium polysaccharide secretion pseudopilin HpsC [Trichodesmium sp. MAG_R04]|nr:hormogonium polysaccharide secretion pseudopilin HpsC [Trichodesmium sp. MAG_R04]